MNRSIDISFKENWKNAWRSSMQRSQMLAGFIILIIVLTLLPFFFNSVEKRPGMLIEDLVLAHLPSIDVSLAIFGIIWGMAILALVRGIQKPAIFIKYVWVYAFIVIARMITISLIPLEPPVGLIQLTDPLTGIFYGHANITKDLFFSGHTSTLFLIFLCMERKWERVLALLATVVVGVLLLVQHVHYTVDVIAAPFMVYLIYTFITSMLVPENNN